MAAKWCTVCRKPVQPIGGFGCLDAFLTFWTCGLWLFVALFKKPICPMCRNNGTLQHLG